MSPSSKNPSSWSAPCEERPVRRLGPERRAGRAACSSTRPAVTAARVAMEPDGGGFWRPVGGLAEPPADRPLDYGYLIDGGDVVLPDPRARRAPHGVHGLSRTFDPDAHRWSDQLWTGRQLPGGIVYELHVGTFTPEGTLLSAIDRLDHLVELGVTLVELMPVNAFNGSHGWGYDGVLWCAVQEEYGGPAAYQAFVDACHQRGLGVIQDVVYNHLGPERQLPAGVRSLHRRRAVEHLGRDPQPGRGELRRGPPLHHRQRADVAAGVPRGRSAAGRRARPRPTPGRPTCWRS